jgi:hypothetical protein
MPWMYTKWFLKCSTRKIKATLLILDAETSAIELVRNTSITPVHALSVRLLGSSIVTLLKYSLASAEYNGIKGSTSTSLSLPLTRPII